MLYFAFYVDDTAALHSNVFGFVLFMKMLTAVSNRLKLLAYLYLLQCLIRPFSLKALFFGEFDPPLAGIHADPPSDLGFGPGSC